MAPRERALFVAQRLLSEGKAPPEVVRALCEQGFDDVEARVAVAAAGSQGEDLTGKWAEDDARKAAGQRGYLSALIAALLLATGGLLFALTQSWLGAIIGLAGVVALLVAARQLLRAEGA